MQQDRERGDAPNPALFALRGARIVQALETNEKQELNMADIKAMLGALHVGDELVAELIEKYEVTGRLTVAPPA